MVSQEFRKQVKDALEHLYDTIYLQTHPLLTQIAGPTTTNPVTRAQKLRGLLKDAIESLRPQQDSPSNAPREVWRSYLALRYRYVQGMSMAQTENKLSISLRQLHRELHKGLDALSALLWEMRIPESGPTLAHAPPASGSVQELESELNQWQLDRQVCRVQTLVDETLWMLKPLLEQHAVELTADLPADLPPVLADLTLTRQALFKALRLMAQNARNAISLKVDPRDEQIDIILHCPSCALSTSDEEWQMIELLINQQGGKLVTDIQPEIGTRVTLSLPRASQTRVLVVDDNQAIHQLFERYLAPQHYEIVHARSGQEALQLAVEAHPDLITLDVMMPSMDGWQVLRDLAQNPATTHIPVIVCSVLKEPELAFSLGARAYLKKPVDRLELLATLTQFRPAANLLEATLPPTPEGS
jgi:CheY-like chemotaxis protein